MFFLLLDILIAYILDLLIGDPYWMPHPVSFIGNTIKRLERVLRRYTDCKATELKEASERRAGLILALSTIMITFLTVFGIILLAEMVSPILFHIFNIYFIYSALAARCLALESNKVLKALKHRDIIKARKSLSMLVGRETENLNFQEVIRGTVETVAENTVDGVISPLIYAFIGSVFSLGAPVVYAFKAISTLDSMVGYMNEKYINFGRVSARIDDAANYIPARLSGLLIPFGAMLCGKSFLKSFSVMLRDRRNHKSPNCAYPEAAVAGALGVQLGGNNIYFGKVVEKPTIGDTNKKLDANDISDTIKIMYAASFITLILGVIISLIFM